MFCVALLGVLPRTPIVISEISTAPEAHFQPATSVFKHTALGASTPFLIPNQRNPSIDLRHPREDGDPYNVSAPSAVLFIERVAGRKCASGSRRLSKK